MFEQCLYFNTTSLARQLEREWVKAFKPFGLTPSQAFMLRVILDKPQSYQNELAKEMNITKPTASRGLDGLVKLGLIERRASEQDAREIQIYPTPQAKELKNDLNAASVNAHLRGVELCQIQAFKHDAACAGIGQTREHHAKGRFARARLAHHAQGAALVQGKVGVLDSAENTALEQTLFELVVLSQALDLDQRSAAQWRCNALLGEHCTPVDDVVNHR